MTRLLHDPDFLTGLGLALGLCVFLIGYQVGAYVTDRRELRRLAAELGGAARKLDRQNAAGARRTSGRVV